MSPLLGSQESKDGALFSVGPDPEERRLQRGERGSMMQQETQIDLGKVTFLCWKHSSF